MRMGDVVVMSFQSSRALDCLLSKGFVFTFRKKWRRQGRNWINTGRGQSKICNVFVVNLGRYLFDNLTEFVPYSGFRDVNEWEQEIKKLNGGKFIPEGWLYLVIKVN